jgi:hypothetical protein
MLPGQQEPLQFETNKRIQYTRRGKIELGIHLFRLKASGAWEKSVTIDNQILCGE